MALNIKNKRVCDLAREAADRFGTTQVDVIEQALELLLANEERRVADRLARIQAVSKQLQESFTEEEREALRHVDTEIYDEDGLLR